MGTDVCGAGLVLLLLVEPQCPQAVADFRGHFLHTQAFLHGQLAGKGGAGRASVSQIKGHTTVLAILIPAEASVGDLLRRQILKAPQQRIVLRNLELPAQDGDLHQACEWAKEGGRARS
jgi:hypothetical protein